MTNQLPHIIKHWFTQRDNYQWVLGSIYKTEGPTYRKAGAMMLLNDGGQKLGLLSGGCLESDIHKHAMHVIHSKKSMALCYDGSDEDDVSFQLGIGCGGTVHLMLQPILAENNYLNLLAAHAALTQRKCGTLFQKIPDASGEVSTFFVDQDDTRDTSPLMHMSGRSASLITQNNELWLASEISPSPHMLIVGGGVDARPLVNLASNIGWEVTLCDPRPANARREHFLSANTITRVPIKNLASEVSKCRINAAVVMTHNLQMDADAIQALQDSSIKYLALLGPESRKINVLNLAGLDHSTLRIPVAGPAGLNIGAELPEGIALSILAECYAVLHSVNPDSFNTNFELSAHSRGEGI